MSVKKIIFMLQRGSIQGLICEVSFIDWKVIESRRDKSHVFFGKNQLKVNLKFSFNPAIFSKISANKSLYLLFGNSIALNLFSWECTYETTTGMNRDSRVSINGNLIKQIELCMHGDFRVNMNIDIIVDWGSNDLVSISISNGLSLSFTLHRVTTIF